MKTQNTISIKLFKLRYVLLAVLLGSFSLSAQSTLNTSGGSQSVATGSFDYSIGEMTVVSTQSNTNLTVTQGLLQVESSTLGLPEILISNQELSVFPNPVENILNIKPYFKSAGELLIQLFDIQGKRILQKTFHLQSGLEQQELDLSTLSDASYMLNVQFNKGTQNHRQTYKIIKASRRN